MRTTRQAEREIGGRSDVILGLSAALESLAPFLPSRMSRVRIPSPAPTFSHGTLDRVPGVEPGLYHALSRRPSGF